MQDVSFHFCNRRITVSVSSVTEGRLQIHSLKEKRSANDTFKAGPGVVLFDRVRNTSLRTNGKELKFINQERNLFTRVV